MPFLKFLRSNAPFLAAGVLLSYLSSFGQTFFISVFAGEIRGEYALSHGDWGTIYALGTLASAAVMLYSGALTDRFRVRSLGIAVLVGLAGACGAMATTSVVWALPFVIFALRLMGQGMTSHLSGVAMARWFSASRGRALAISALGFSLGEVTLPIGFVALKPLMDWRMLWLVAAGIVLCSVPVLNRLLRLERTPQSMAQDEQSLGMGCRHWTRGQVLRHPLFWMVLPAMMAPASFGSAFFFQQVHLAEVKGWDHLALVSIFPLYSIAAVASMLASGWAVDRFGSARLMPLYQLPYALFFLLFPMADTLVAAAPVMLLMGLTAGAQTTVPVAFWAEFYGTRHIGAIKATAMSAMVLGSAIGPVATGLLIDAGIGFPSQMMAISLFFLASSALVLAGVRIARRDLPPAPKIDVARP